MLSYSRTTECLLFPEILANTNISKHLNCNYSHYMRIMTDGQFFQ